MPDETLPQETEDLTLKAILKHSDHNSFYAGLKEYYDRRGYLTEKQAKYLKGGNCFQCNGRKTRATHRSYPGDDMRDFDDEDFYGDWNGSFDRD